LDSEATPKGTETLYESSNHVRLGVMREMKIEVDAENKKR